MEMCHANRLKIGKKKSTRVYYIQVKQNILDILLDVLLLCQLISFFSLPLSLCLPRKNTKKYLFVDIRELIGNRYDGRKEKRKKGKERRGKGGKNIGKITDLFLLKSISEQ